MTDVFADIEAKKKNMSLINMYFLLSVVMWQAPAGIVL